MEKIKKDAVKYFHQGVENWNCAQAIHKSYQALTGKSDQDIELHYRPKGGGRAEGGICGTIYAARELLAPTDVKSLEEELIKEYGGLTCHELKRVYRVPCTDIVARVDSLIAERLKLHVESKK